MLFFSSLYEYIPFILFLAGSVYTVYIQDMRELEDPLLRPRTILEFLYDDIFNTFQASLDETRQKIIEKKRFALTQWWLNAKSSFYATILSSVFYCMILLICIIEAKICTQFDVTIGLFVAALIEIGYIILIGFIWGTDKCSFLRTNLTVFAVILIEIVSVFFGDKLVNKDCLLNFISLNWVNFIVLLACIAGIIARYTLRYRHKRYILNHIKKAERMQIQAMSFQNIFKYFYISNNESLPTSEADFVGNNLSEDSKQKILNICLKKRQ